MMVLTLVIVLKARVIECITDLHYVSANTAVTYLYRFYHVTKFQLSV